MFFKTKELLKVPNTKYKYNNICNQLIRYDVQFDSYDSIVNDILKMIMVWNTNIKYLQLHDI